MVQNNFTNLFLNMLPVLHYEINFLRYDVTNMGRDFLNTLKLFFGQSVGRAGVKASQMGHSVKASLWCDSSLINTRFHLLYF